MISVVNYVRFGDIMISRASLKSLEHQIRRNLDFVVGGLAIVLALFIGVVQNNIGLIIGAISSTFLLICVAIIRDRNKLQEVLSSVKALQHFSLLALRDNFEVERDQIIEGAESELWLLLRYGYTLRENRSLERFLSRGTTLKIIICASDDPNVLNMLSYRVPRDISELNTLENAKDEIEKATKRFEDLKKIHQHCDIKIYPIKYVPPYVIFVADPYSDKGKALAIINTFRVKYTNGPSILINASDNSDLFKFFRDEFERYLDAIINPQR